MPVVLQKLAFQSNVHSKVLTTEINEYWELGIVRG